MSISKTSSRSTGLNCPGLYVLCCIGCGENANQAVGSQEQSTSLAGIVYVLCFAYLAVVHGANVNLVWLPLLEHRLELAGVVERQETEIDIALERERQLPIGVDFGAWMESEGQSDVTAHSRSP